VATDADQGFSQRILYIHVPIALTAYAFFGWVREEGARVTLEREPALYSRATWRSTRESSIGSLTMMKGHLGQDLVGPLVALERESVVLPGALPLLRGLLHALFGTRSNRPERANICAVYALFGCRADPIRFLAIRLANQLIPPGSLHAQGRRWPARVSPYASVGRRGGRLQRRISTSS